MNRSAAVRRPNLALPLLMPSLVPSPVPSNQRGVAALLVTMLLFFSMILGIAFVHRNLVFEQRASTNQYRSTQAFEAAEAGLEWTIAQLGKSQASGLDCLPSTDPGATSFRERYLTYDASTATFTPATWVDGGAAKPLQATCVRAGSGWDCNCPASGAPSLVLPISDAPAPAFTIQFQATGRPGLLRVLAVGCTSLGGACASSGTAPTDASVRTQVMFGLLPAIRTAPAAALTTRGAVDANTSAFGAHNRDAVSGGLAIHAGGAVNAAAAHLTVPAGAITGSAIARNDGNLAALSNAQFFATYFGIDKSGWARQPVVRRVTCNGDCTSALQALIARDRAVSLLYVDGNLLIKGPATLGSAQHPVAIIASGNVQLNGTVAMTGVLYGGTIIWDGGAVPGALLRGALISEGDYQGDGTPEIVYDAEVLARLEGYAGTFARVNGSWRDF